MTALSTAATSSSDPRRELARVCEAINAQRMAPRLRAAMPPGPRGACHVLDAKYQPGLGCTVLYRIGDHLVRGDLLDGDEVGDGPNRLVVAPGVRLHVFPRDPGLPTLPACVDPAGLTRVLRHVLPDDGHRLLGCRLRLIRYRPGRRVTLAVGLRRAGAAPSDAARSCIVKAYHDEGKAEAVAGEAQGLAAAVDPGGPLRLAPVHAHVPELRLVVQGRVDGVALHTLLVGRSPTAADALGRTAQALACLHRIPPVGYRRRRVEAELARFADRAGRVRRVDAAAGAALERLAGRLAATAPDVDGALAVVHGDCKPSQFMLGDRGSVILLDLDSCGRADPAGDVGTFLATLRQHALRRSPSRPAGAADDAAPLAEHFLRGYLAGTPVGERRDLRRRIAWYEAVALERKALRCFARSPRSPLTAALVALGHRRLDRIGGGR